MAQHPQADCVLSIVSFHEQLLGAHTFLNRARRPNELIHGYLTLNEMLGTYRTTTVLPFDAAATAVYFGLVAQRIRVGTMDLRIAAIALSRNLTLLTRNAVDFRRVPGLVIEDWTV
jgi:tRNA(fMet)-specific endonuclease VapC